MLPDGYTKCSDLLPEENSGQFLGVCLNPFFGTFTITYDVVFFEDGYFRSWSNSQPCLVIAWKRIEDNIKKDMFPELTEVFNSQKIWVEQGRKQFGNDVFLPSVWKYH